MSERKHIPLEECKDRHFYKLNSRNLLFGVYDAQKEGFVGIREKFGFRYPFVEYHYDAGMGTARPLQELELPPVPPEISLQEGFRWVGLSEEGKLRDQFIENSTLFKMLEVAEKEPSR